VYIPGMLLIDSMTPTCSVPREGHLASDEEHLARRQPFIAQRRDITWGMTSFGPVAMAMVICMEMMSALVGRVRRLLLSGAGGGGRRCL